MDIRLIHYKAFSVIGKLGSTNDGEGFIKRLWEEVNRDFKEINDLVLYDSDHHIEAIFGLMSDFSLSFKPWENNFSEGYYLAGPIVRDDAVAPEGFTKWTVKENDYLAVLALDYQDTFNRMINDFIPNNGYVLTGAVFDYTDPLDGFNYLWFPIKKK